MKSDAELIRLAAEKVCGWTWRPRALRWDGKGTEKLAWSDDCPSEQADWNPVANIADAWILLTKLWDSPGENWTVDIHLIEGGQCRVTVNKDGSYKGHCTNEEPGTAITYACLRAVGEQV